MIKLFRNIRQALLNEGNTSKYLKYALGEIVLVVIGILIALQINNWNANRIQNKKEAVYLKNIKRDLTEQLKSIETQIQFEKYINSVASPLISTYKKQHSFIVDSAFTSNIGKLTGRKTFVKNVPTYAELVSSGNLDIISKNDLKDQIITYYQELERVELIINKNNNLYTDAVFIPEMIGLIEFQIANDFTLNNLLNYTPKKDDPLVDLNEDNLKKISQNLLQSPGNELKFINAIHFRNYITVVHNNLLIKIKIATQDLITKLGSND